MEHLDQESIDTFANVVASPYAKPPATEGGGNDIRLILRFKGDVFPFPASDEESKPPLVVGLAHHRTANEFILFSFTSLTMPCRLARFDRDGQAISKEEEETNAPYLWSESDAEVLVAAVNRCHESGCRYFERNVDVAPPSQRYQRDHIRLVPKTEHSDESDCDGTEERSDDVDDEEQESTDGTVGEEAKAIRTLIVNELLDSQLIGGIKFHNPDTNFMHPLALSISRELEQWRNLSQIAPELSDWPLSPTQQNKTNDKSTKDIKEMNGIEKSEFKALTLDREEQLEKSVALCKVALKRMDSHLLANHWTCPKRVFQMGNECATSLAALEHLQLRHVEDWRAYHNLLDEIIDDNGLGDFKESAVLKPWLENIGELTSMDNISSMEGGEVALNDYVNPESVDELMLLRSWIAEDKALLQLFSPMGPMIEQSMKSEGQEATQKARAQIQSLQQKMQTFKTNATRSTRDIATKLVNQWYADDESSEDENIGDEDEPWAKGGTEWDTDEIEAHLSFGWQVSGIEKQPTLSFIVDHDGMVRDLKNSIGRISRSAPSGRSKACEAFKREWSAVVTPKLDDALNSARQYMKKGDLRNACILALCCCSVLCDSVGQTLEFFTKSSCEYYDSYSEEGDYKKAVNDTLRTSTQGFDVILIKLGLSYFDEESPLLEAGAQWLLSILRSGALYLPKHINWVDSGQTYGYGRRREPQWNKVSHPGAESLSHCWKWKEFLKGRTDATARQWLKLESPLLVKERFLLMIDQGRAQEAIALAHMSRGDHDALNYLLTNGYRNEAIEQAGASGNLEGLARLSRDLVKSDPNSSLLCMQAHIIGMEKHGKVEHIKSIEDFANLFRSNWIVSDVEKQCKESSTPDMPPLHLICTMSTARLFLQSAMSTSVTQDLMEKKYFIESGLSLGVVAIAIASCSKDSIQEFLSKTGIFCVNKNGYSGLLIKFGYYPASLGQRAFLDVCCAIYESAIILMKNGCKAVFCVDLALLSAVQISVMTGCEIFALNVIQGLKDLKEGQFEPFPSTSPLTCLTVCYAVLFSAGLTDSLPRIATSLLDTFLKVKICPSLRRSISSIANEDVEEAGLWAAIAYRHHGQSVHEVVTLLFNHIIELNKPEEEDDYYQGNFEARVVRAAWKISHIDKAGHSVEGEHSMTLFANSSRRKLMSEVERNEMLSGFISWLFEASISFCPAAIANCVDIHRRIDASFWQYEASEVGERLSTLTGVSLALSKKKSLRHTCAVMCYIDLFSGQGWCSRHKILELGLSWLRNALSSSPDEMIQFDNVEPPFRCNSRESLANLYPNIFHEGGYYESNPFDGFPKFTARTFIAVLQTHIPFLQGESPELAHLCREAFALCKVLDFIMFPTPHRLKAVISSQSDLGQTLETRAFFAVASPRVEFFPEPSDFRFP
ncbi:hypothetical protein ACHAWF_012630, partial [Thalassiosira exigua]